MPLSLLVVASETPDQQAARRRRSGMASHETYVQTLKQMVPDARIGSVCCVDGSDAPSDGMLRAQDGVLFAGSPIQMHEDTPEVRAAAAFMARVFAVGVPTFGSCAGLQIAAVVAGGTVRPFDGAMEAGFARRILPTPAGSDHPMLAGRPGTWDAPAMHSALVDRMPMGGTILAMSDDTPVQAAEIRSGAGLFWGVQYHPELALTEIAEALCAQAETLIEQGLLRAKSDVDRYAEALKALEDDPSRRDLAWQLGVDAEVIETDRRRLEVANFLRHVGTMAT